ncbi:patatin-like phospholipase family protein [Paraglaciecola aquimarina]|uniref:Patatin-like phospholipase family protein n=1 Tax=Paraglaciecola algarum TaxID=3050085 RepID=A0ABS9D480_9ALTE|nr:patatin-like phospholipase family protein [Paraglaciecola sp. G1-23]MCF2947733.1 patatin-like phospholipase family protein [Paraglaciecola sp. G1-23]
MSKVVPIFSGGGTRLSAHIGILDALKDLGVTFEHIVGVSGGSIVSSLYCSGMPLEEIKELSIKTHFKDFKGFSLLTLLFQGGLSNGDKFENWMDDKLAGKTFSDISHNLNILATDVNGGGPVIFNKVNSPNLKVSKAVRFSMSIPLIFSFQSYKKHILVDGAILSEDALYKDWSGDGTQVICFRLKSEPVADDKFKKSWLPIKQYVMMLVRTFMTAMSREYVHDQYWKNTIIVNTGKLSPVDFNITVEQKEQLYKVGYQTALEFVPNRLNRTK